ncbi:hypothetical protein D3C75_566220 [compost metagenome]
MQDTQHHEFATAACCHFGEILKEMDIVAAGSRGFQKLTHFIDHDQHTTTLWPFGLGSQISDQGVNAVAACAIGVQRFTQGFG